MGISHHQPLKIRQRHGESQIVFYASQNESGIQWQRVMSHRYQLTVSANARLLHGFYTGS
jgi:hypothetical protein